MQQTPAPLSVCGHAHIGVNVCSLKDVIRNFKSTGFRDLVRIRSDENA